MSDPPRVYNWPDRLLALLVHRWRKAKIQGLVRAIGLEGQELEDAIHAAITGRRLDNAMGDALDAYGEIVGQVRQGEVEGLYRELIKARIITNMRAGQSGALLEVAAYIFGPNAGPVRFIPEYPAGYRLIAYVPAPLADDRRSLATTWLLDMTPAGVGLGHVVEAPRPAFTFDTPTPTAAAAGFDLGKWAVTL